MPFDVEAEAENIVEAMTHDDDSWAPCDKIHAVGMVIEAFTRAIAATRDEVEREDARLVCKWCLSGRELFREELYPESEFLWWHRIAGEVFECYASPIHERCRRREKTNAAPKG